MAEIKSLKFGIPKRKKFSIDGDESRFIELDTGDTGIVTRWAEIEPWFADVSKRLEAFNTDELDPTKDVDKSKEIIAEMATLDKEMREKMCYLFDSDVCTPIVGERGSLLRPVNGDPIFYTILETLIPLYEADIKIEAAKSQKRVAKHTAKYAK